MCTIRPCKTAKDPMQRAKAAKACADALLDNGREKDAPEGRGSSRSEAFPKTFRTLPRPNPATVSTIRSLMAELTWLTAKRAVCGSDIVQGARQFAAIEQQPIGQRPGGLDGGDIPLRRCRDGLHLLRFRQPFDHLQLVRVSRPGAAEAWVSKQELNHIPVAGTGLIGESPAVPCAMGRSQRQCLPSVRLARSAICSISGAPAACSNASDPA